MDNRSIGILDSGVGGLTVWKEITEYLPHESTIYVGDSKNAPYGKKSPQEILRLAKQLISFLLAKNAKLIIIACNTITVNGIDILRASFPQIPIIGTVPVVKSAAERTKNNLIGLLVTGATAKSEYNTSLVKKFTSDKKVIVYGTNKLVPLIEKNDWETLKQILSQELNIFKKEKVDTLVLGSTHYPLIRSYIQEVLPDILLLDSGTAIARQVERVLRNNNALASKGKVQHTLYTTGDKAQLDNIVSSFAFPKMSNIVTATITL